MSFEWAVGLFEGEGSLCKVRQNGKSWKLSIEMTDKDVVQMFVNVMGTGKIYDRPPRFTGRKPTYLWQCYRKAEIIRIASKMLPLLGDRRAHRVLNCLDNYEID